MPIISGSSEHDYSNLSYTSSSTLNHFFPVAVESQTLKGVKYQRAKRIYDPDDLYTVDFKREVIINVGGFRYLIPWSTLDEFPMTRLGKLRFCSNYDEIIQICDDFDEDTNEFFFDRNPCAFRMIVSFLAVGKLRLLREMCALSFQDELMYWGIEESNLEHCCLRKLFQKLEELAEFRKEEEAQRTRETICVLEDHSKMGYYMSKLRDMVENPQSGLPGKVFACLSILFVATTAINLCVSTMPDLRAEEDRGECSQKCYNIFIIETVCVAWFSLEFLLRFVQAKMEDEQKTFDKPGSNSYLEKIGLVLRVLRALRILYVMRLARHSLGLQTLGLTVRRCTREFGLLLLFLCVAVTLFAPLVHLAENEMGRCQEFTSVPASYWWAIISMTTVGYGDMVPRSIPGQVVALSSILSGILIMAFPATSIFHTFSRSYAELKRDQERLQSRLMRLKDGNQSEESDTFNDTDSLASEETYKYFFAGK
ncbi:potassium voltage-gated channel subfamily G member 4 isoform X2 [Hyla sarda]|uniref:potassium voltage-gated channel subfamily G member 4 isoform X2 n=1 Tax=Hyla sarda TaxID=327740 RepID=UPI0024C3F720|nr:potassium voltage-gated channel subfamily G member 4 isoform X2 [Hyla sarda]